MSVPITAVWMHGGENEIRISVEVDGVWRRVITEYVPLHGNDGNIWPISHIAEESAIKNGRTEAAPENGAQTPGQR